MSIRPVTASALPAITQRILDELDDRSSRPHLFVLLAIVIVGFLLRFYGFYAGQGYHYFAINDELFAYQYALSFLAGEEKALYLGQPYFAGGQAPGPIWTVFWVLLLKLGGGSVNAAIFWMGVLNTFTIYLVYLLANKFLDPRHALATAGIYATAPWPVYLSVGMWNPLALAFLGGLLFLSLWAVSNQDYSRSIFWVCLLAAIIPQFHMVGLFYVPAIVLLLLIMPTRLNTKWLAGGIIAGAAVYLPYLIGEIQHDWDNTRRILANNQELSFSVLKIVSAPVTVLSSVPARWMGSFDELKRLGDTYFGSYIVLIGFSLVSAANGMTYLGSFLKSFSRALRGKWRALRRTYKESPAVMFIGILLVVPLLLFLPTGQNYASRYTIIIFPLLFLLPVFFLKKLKSPVAKRLWIGNMVLIALFNVSLLVSYYTFQNGLIEDSDRFLASFKKLESLRQTLRADAGSDTFIEIRLADDVSGSPERTRKTVWTVAHYLDIYQTFISHTTGSSRKKAYLLKLEKNVQPGQSVVVYRGNGIAIIDMGVRP